MYHYQFNIGDYRKDTGHLSILEHGIYRMLIDSYYSNEGALPADDAKLMRTHCIRTADEEQAYRNVITDFFELRDGEYFHSGCEKVMVKIYEKSAKAKESAEKRWANKNKGLGGEECEPNAEGMRTHSEGNANGMLPETHNPRPETQLKPTSKPKVPPCPVEKIIELYKSTAQKLPAVRIVDEPTKANIRARWLQDPRFQTLEFWENFMSYCEENIFLSGQSEPRDNKPPFRACLSWIVKPTNFANIVNGKYDR